MKPARKDWPNLARAVDKSGIITFDEVIDLCSHANWVTLQYRDGTRTREVRFTIPQPGCEWTVRRHPK